MIAILNVAGRDFARDGVVRLTGRREAAFDVRRIETSRVEGSMLVRDGDPKGSIGGVCAYRGVDPFQRSLDCVFAAFRRFS